MKKVLILKLMILLMIFMLFSCTKDEKMIGIWDDVIHLSARTAEFDAPGDSITITTKGKTWWISFISLDDSTRLDFDGIKILSDKYKIVSDNYIVERRNSNTLFISLDANPKNTLRILKVGLVVFDYSDLITITQKFQ